MKDFHLKPGVLDELAREAGVRSDKELAVFLGVTETQLEQIRYGAITPQTALLLGAKAATHRKAADLLDGHAA